MFEYLVSGELVFNVMDIETIGTACSLKKKNNLKLQFQVLNGLHIILLYLYHIFLKGLTNFKKSARVVTKFQLLGYQCLNLNEKPLVLFFALSKEIVAVLLLSFAKVF